MVEEIQEQPNHEETEQPSMEENPVEEESLEENINEDLLEETPKMFDQNYVNELVGKTRVEAREKALRSFLEKYGVDNENDLDNIFGRGQSYSILEDNYNNVNTRLLDVMAENALLKSKTDETRWDDIRLILKGKGLEITPENIAMELTTHPEWQQKNMINNTEGNQDINNVLTPEMAEQMGNNSIRNDKPVAKIKKFGSDVPSSEESSDEENFINKYFRV